MYLFNYTPPRKSSRLLSLSVNNFKHKSRIHVLIDVMTYNHSKRITLKNVTNSAQTALLLRGESFVCHKRSKLMNVLFHLVMTIFGHIHFFILDTFLKRQTNLKSTFSALSVKLAKMKRF